MVIIKLRNKNNGETVLGILNVMVGAEIAGPRRDANKYPGHGSFGKEEKRVKVWWRSKQREDGRGRREEGGGRREAGAGRREEGGGGRREGGRREGGRREGRKYTPWDLGIRFAVRRSTIIRLKGTKAPSSYHPLLLKIGPELLHSFANRRPFAIHPGATSGPAPGPAVHGTNSGGFHARGFVKYGGVPSTFSEEALGFGEGDDLTSAT
jgi:hypothetical protein